MNEESIILFIFEGARTEVQIYENLKLNFSKYNSITHIHATFDTNIYELYLVLQKDGDQDIVELVRSRSVKNKEMLSGISRDAVAEVYLFFDYEGHAPSATDESLKELIEYFDNETEEGKLYISYPMVESIKHVNKAINFKETIVEAKKKINYKNIVSESCDSHLMDLTKLTLSSWYWLIELHGKKLNFVVNDDYVFPMRFISQLEVFESQLEKYILPSSTVAVLSAFPILILDYYGVDKIRLQLSIGS